MAKRIGSFAELIRSNEGTAYTHISSVRIDSTVAEGITRVLRDQTTLDEHHAWLTEQGSGLYTLEHFRNVSEMTRHTAKTAPVYWVYHFTDETTACAFKLRFA